MSENQSCERETAGRKGGAGPNGPGAPPAGEQDIHVPPGLFLRMRTANADAVRIMMWLIYQSKIHPGSFRRVREISEATGVATPMTLHLLLELRDEGFVELGPRGVRLANVPREKWMPDP